MKLEEILTRAGKHKGRKRIGRGCGSGQGKTSGRGHRGYGARAGSGKLLGFEGGQNPAMARIPKRGFSNAVFRKEYQVVNVAALEKFDDKTKVDAAALAAARLIDDPGKPVKILGGGKLTKALTVTATRFSATAAEKIAKAGGSTAQP